MDPHSLRILEYDAVRAQVVERTATSLGRDCAGRMEPLAREPEVRRALQLTTEAVGLLTGGGFPFGGIRDLRELLRAAGAGSVLEPQALLAAVDTAAGSRKLRSFLLQRAERAPLLVELARNMGEFPEQERAIAEAISDEGLVRDEASPLLARLRKEIRRIQGRMTDRLQSILRNSLYRDMIQDPVVTTRSGRYCIPVKSEYRSQFGGLVHDQSSSGATVFMEPAAVVELGNELRQAEAREQQEVERILRALTALLGRVSVEFTDTLGLAAEIDFVAARGRYSLAVDGVQPEVNTQGFLRLVRARHPLLEGEVVPVDLELGKRFSQLVITGPNTGGKTVTLKTTGLFVLMAQSGLHVPAAEGTALPILAGVYADIGDEQSIQQSLSTFSGHVRNIARILAQVESAYGRRTLVLLDELGAGTDPTEGAALARGILAQLLQQRALTIATTHYGELKEYAYATEGVQNASVEFDPETLRPTYRLLLGVPGASHAFAIAARLGLPDAVIQSAQSLISADRAELTDVIRQLTEDRRLAESEARRAAEAACAAAEKLGRVERDVQRTETERREVLARARSEAEEILRSARRELDRVRQEVRRLEREARKSTAKPAADLRTVRERLLALEKETEQVLSDAPAEAAARSEPSDPRDSMEAQAPEFDTQPPEAGDLVWVPGLNQRGTLLSLPSGGKAQVQFGSMRMSVPVEGIRRIMRRPAPARRPLGAAAAGAALRLQARTSISPEVSLRGMRAEEALVELDRYLDDAALAGLSPVRIVHGKGTGALKKAVWEYLTGQPQVSRFSHPAEEEGGTGVTVVELRE
jgi:DNA mismatch repair protein MutS2